MGTLETVLLRHFSPQVPPPRLIRCNEKAGMQMWTHVMHMCGEHAWVSPELRPSLRDSACSLRLC